MPYSHSEGQDDLLMVVRRVEALGKFLDSDDGKNLLAGTKRASNILSIEEKRKSAAFDGEPDAGALQALRGEGARRSDRPGEGRKRAWPSPRKTSQAR